MEAARPVIAVGRRQARRARIGEQAGQRGQTRRRRRLVAFGEGVDEAAGDLIELRLILRRDRVAQVGQTGERAGLDRHRRRGAGDRHAVDGHGVAASRPAV